MAMAPFIDRIRNLRPDLIGAAEYPLLLDWYARMQARPAFTRAFDFKDARTAALPNI
jgi:glutathione S-transferase